MGRKSSAKAHAPAPPPPPESKKSFPSLLVVALAAAVLGIGALAYFRTAAPEEVASTAPVVTDQIAADVASIAKFGPHKQEQLPPLDIPAYGTDRPAEAIRAAYTFAAEHPEVLSYVPCFCGCEMSGHKGNHDCFVRARDVNGDVIEWDQHGIECAVCLDVATRAMQMHNAGSSVADIRAAVEKEWSSHSTTHTPTPQVPATN